MSCEPNFIFRFVPIAFLSSRLDLRIHSIDGHDMTIIETDGVSTQPVVVDSIQILYDID